MKQLVKIASVLIAFAALAFTSCDGNGSSNDHNGYTYTVTFDSQGADVEADPTSKTVESPATTVDALPAAPNKTGYTFAGWWTEINGGGTEFTASTDVTEDITVFASWESNSYTVTFDSQGADVEADPTIKTVEPPATNVDALPTDPTKAGFNFAGWSTEINGGGTEFTASSAVTGNITVYAMWSTTGLSFTLTNGNAEYRVTHGTAISGYVSIPGYWLGKKVTSIGISAFANCTGLTGITIPASVTSIGDSAFQDCTGLTSVTIPNSVTSIGSTAFYCCNHLTTISVSAGNSYYSSTDGVLFNRTNTAIIQYPAGKTGTNYSIPIGVNTIGDYAFNNCTGLTSITIPASVTSIGSNAFSYCFSLTSVTIPPSVTSIGVETFYDCYSLTSITIPASVTSIGYFTFQASGLKSLSMENMTAPIYDDNALSGIIGCTLHIHTVTTGYNVAPWTNTSTFSSIVTDL